jgi:Asp-tRNA(Asn)/Glu-tRNA(Gln) amidotransferase A subunit family amidase
MSEKFAPSKRKSPSHDADAILNLSAREMAAQIAKGDLSAVDLVQASLKRAHAINPSLNAFCQILDEEALAKAKAADKAVKDGVPLGPLHGVPFAVKDLTPTKGHLTSCGSWALGDWVPDKTALCIQRLEGAGAIIMGKTTTPEFAFSAFTQSPRWGVTRNPWNPEHTSGGSSGGSAVAVSTGCVPFAEGSDMGGSIRIPAGCCGIVGLKPSLGRIPMTILPTVFDNISHFGPLARTVDDAVMFLEVAAGPSDQDINSITERFQMRKSDRKQLKKMRITYSLDQGYYDVDPDVQSAFEAVLEDLKSAGAEVQPVTLE